MPVQVEDIIPEEAAQEEAPPQEEAQEEAPQEEAPRRPSAEAGPLAARTSRSRLRGKCKT